LRHSNIRRDNESIKKGGKKKRINALPSAPSAGRLHMVLSCVRSPPLGSYEQQMEEPHLPFQHYHVGRHVRLLNRYIVLEAYCWRNYEAAPRRGGAEVRRPHHVGIFTYFSVVSRSKPLGGTTSAFTTEEVFRVLQFKRPYCGTPVHIHRIFAAYAQVETVLLQSVRIEVVVLKRLRRYEPLQFFFYQGSHTAY